MSEKIGEFIHRKIKGKGLEDKQVAGFLNISPSTLRKTYPLEDMYISRIIEFCKLLGEDIILEFYYGKEPLKSMREKEIQEGNKKVQELSVINENQEKTIKQLQDHIETQKELFIALKKEIQRLESLAGK
jgi:hypothetical protein